MTRPKGDAKFVSDLVGPLASVLAGQVNRTEVFVGPWLAKIYRLKRLSTDGTFVRVDFIFRQDGSSGPRGSVDWTNNPSREGNI